MHAKILFVGAGSMAEAMIRGMLHAEVVQSAQLIVTNRANRDRLDYLAQKYGVRTDQDMATALEGADVVILAMKPKDVHQALERIMVHVKETPLFITLLAGIPTRLIEDAFEQPVPVIRAMPNTSCTVRQSATAIAEGQFVTETHIAFAVQMFESVGTVTLVNESMLDIVTGLSGSGPAYVYLMVEALVGAGVEAGLEYETSRSLVLQTLFGAGMMLRETGEDPGELRRQVTSPGGTTMAALGVLEERGFADAIKDAVFRAAARSEEMRGEFCKPDHLKKPV